jgi:signal transduction histidine kinase
LTGKKHDIINSGYHSKAFFAHLWATIRSNNIWQGEIKNKAKDGSYYWVDTVILPVKAEGKRQYLSLRKEITERKALEAKKEEYLNALEDLIFITSHEIRRPVCNILGLIELQNIDFTKEELRSILHHLKKSARELDNFTRHLNSYLGDLKEKLK